MATTDRAAEDADTEEDYDMTKEDADTEEEDAIREKAAGMLDAVAPAAMHCSCQCRTRHPREWP
jgi:hypothetical protein